MTNLYNIDNYTLSAVVLAGGFGGRFYPFTKNVPKELLPLQGIPVVHWVVRENLEVNLKGLHIIRRYDTALTEEHFAASIAVDEYIKNQHGENFAEVIFDMLRALISFSPEHIGPYGTLSPFLQAVDVLPESDYYLVSFCDEIFLPDATGFGPLKSIVSCDLKADLVISALPIWPLNSQDFGFITFENKVCAGDFAVSTVVAQKPYQSKPNFSYPVVSRIRIKSEIIPHIRKLKEDGWSDLLSAAVASSEPSRIHGYITKHKWATVGDPQSYFDALSIVQSNIERLDMYEFYKWRP